MTGHYLEQSIYDSRFMLDFLNQRLVPFSTNFNPPRTPTSNAAEFFWENAQFSYSDALAY